VYLDTHFEIRFCLELWRHCPDGQSAIWLGWVVRNTAGGFRFTKTVVFLFYEIHTFCKYDNVNQHVNTILIRKQQ
jgi:hypothetical protein